METSTSSGAATYRSLSSTNPTTTQHDFRFPRRPELSPADQYTHDFDAASPVNSKSSAEPRNDLLDIGLDHSSTYATAQDNLMQSEPFPSMKHDLASEFHNFDQLPQEDPLAIRVWKFYAQTKLLLPDQRRMENLTWRMMHGKLMKHRNEEAEANNRYAARSCLPPPIVRLIFVQYCKNPRCTTLTVSRTGLRRQGRRVIRLPMARAALRSSCGGRRSRVSTKWTP